MKTILCLLVVGLVVVGLKQTITGAIHRVDFQEKLHDVALQVTDKNFDDTKRQVVDVGSKFNLQIDPSEVNIQYAPTSDMNYAQRVVSRVATFNNYRATITVDYSQPILFFPVKRHAKATALIQSAATAKRSQAVPE